jgi:hypothetical protein
MGSDVSYLSKVFAKIVSALALAGLSEFLCTKRFESYPRRARKLLA